MRARARESVASVLNREVSRPAIRETPPDPIYTRVRAKENAISHSIEKKKESRKYSFAVLRRRRQAGHAATAAAVFPAECTEQLHADHRRIVGD